MDDYNAADDTPTVSVFEVEKVALKFSRAHGHYSSNTGFPLLLHTNVSETTNHCCRLALKKKEMLRRVYCGAVDGKLVIIRGGQRRRVISVGYRVMRRSAKRIERTDCRMSRRSFG